MRLEGQASGCAEDIARPCSTSVNLGRQAAGGAREARWSETESLGVAIAGCEQNRSIHCGATSRLWVPDASAGRCRDWQKWQALSGPLL